MACGYSAGGKKNEITGIPRISDIRGIFLHFLKRSVMIRNRRGNNEKR